jgi:hypothetical protein
VGRKRKWEVGMGLYLALLAIESPVAKAALCQSMSNCIKTFPDKISESVQLERRLVMPDTGLHLPQTKSLQRWTCI